MKKRNAGWNGLTVFEPYPFTIWKNINLFVTKKELFMPIRHLVLLRFQASVSAESIQHIEQAFCSLRSKIDVVQDLEWGINNSPEGLAKGFTHCFNLTFADEAGRAAYLPHPAHVAFVEVLKPALDDVLVLDYTV